jgi:ParB-like chromosome segregation protein Spo0J
MIRDLPTDTIDVRSDARAIDEATVAGLVESISQVGLINPIRVRSAGDRWEVIAGAHRLTAIKQLGLTEVQALVVTDDDLHAELAMIDENLCRAELSPSDRARQTARRKAIYLELHPLTDKGQSQAAGMNRAVGNNVNANFAPTFTEATAKVTGQSVRAVELNAERGAKIIDEALDLLRGTHLDTGVYLDKLKGLSPSEQVFAVRRDLAWSAKQEREKKRDEKAAKLQSDIKARAAREVAEMIAEHIPGEWWDAIKSNLYAAGAKTIADALTNITGEAIMDRRHG